MVREFGENTAKGRVYALNPAIIIVLVPIITAATSSVNPLVMIHFGTYVSALSVFFLAFLAMVEAPWGRVQSDVLGGDHIPAPRFKDPERGQRT